MVGNDVVDLLDRESDPATLSARFDARVFAESERCLLRRSADGRVLRWQLWAAKEAAYKAVKKANPRAVFSPVRFVVALDAEEAGAGVRRGVVVRGALCCDVRVETREDAVHAVAFLRRGPPSDAQRAEAAGPVNALRLVHGLLRVCGDGARLADPGAPGSLARAFSRGRLAPLLGVRESDLEIRKRGRVPELWLCSAPAPVDLSLSHHGAVVGFACELPGTRCGATA